MQWIKPPSSPLSSATKPSCGELGVVKLSLFGSVAREEAVEDSDIDLAVIFAEGPRGFAHLERKDRIKERLEEMLGRHVDLIEEPSPARRVQQEIDRDRVLVLAPDRTGQALVDAVAASPHRDISLRPPCARLPARDVDL